MYLITYQKSNGEVFCRIRNTIPECGIGKETSMGWKILDIKCNYKNSYYTMAKCNYLQKKQYKRHHAIKKIIKFIQKYSTSFAFILLMPIYISKLL